MIKKLINCLIVLSAVIFIQGCDTYAKWSDYIPEHALQNMIKSATATCGGETVEGEVDNVNHTVSFIFSSSNDLSGVTVTVEYASRAVKKDGTFDGAKQINLSSPYTMVINNGVDDFTYTFTAKKAEVVQISHTECKVIDLDGDLTIANDIKKYLFDGKWLSKKEAYTETDYTQFYNQTDPLPEGVTTSFTFDVGQYCKLSKLREWPYWAYTFDCPAIWELYAYPLSGEPSGDWTNWVLIGSVDDSGKWEQEMNAEPGSSDDYMVDGTVINFNYSDVPTARYYRYKMIKNFNAIYKDKVSTYWYARVNFISLSEIEVWRYNND